MNLLASKLYDPLVTDSRSCAALLPMTVFDTTNLRLAVNVPSHGQVRFRIRVNIYGFGTPNIFLGILNGSTVIGRVAPVFSGIGASNQFIPCDADFIASGLTPGLTNFDAAYAIQSASVFNSFRYGGPNDNGGDNAFGAFVFEAFDPISESSGSSGSIECCEELERIAKLFSSIEKMLCEIKKKLEALKEAIIRRIY